MRLLLRDCRVNRLRGCCSIRGRSLQGERKRDRLKKRYRTERESAREQEMYKEKEQRVGDGRKTG